MQSLIKKYMADTKAFWDIPEKSFYHNAISLITAQKIAFAKSREIRKKLYALNNNNDEYDSILFEKCSTQDFKKCGMINDELITFIKNITLLANNNDLDIETISKIKYIGPWTLKALKILNRLDDELFLYEDYWIRQRLSELCDCSKVMTLGECNKRTSKWKNKSIISRFLWRINKTGIQKMKNNEILEKSDFL